MDQRAESHKPLTAFAPNTRRSGNSDELDCESWSFHFTPDVRCGKEPLYQAFQIHKHYVFRWKLPRK
jgi:hypothetical protein